MLKITEERIKELINDFKGKTIAVVGDVMLDRYFWGSVTRISPEAPVPVIDLENETYHLGGAANVAHNLKSLGAESLLCGLIGDDNSGVMFTEIANKLGIDSSGLFPDKHRPTTVKTRIIGNNQQIVRLDREVKDIISVEVEKYILNSLIENKKIAGIIFADYNKGVLSEELIRNIIIFAKSENIPVYVDPKFDNFFAYKFATVFKPNRKEILKGLGITLKTKEDIIDAGIELMQRLECENILLTLGADGLMLFESNGEITSVPTIARQVADVSGAGDTTIATLSAFMAGGANIKEAATLANYAAGIVCEKPGIVPISIEELISALNKRNSKI